MSTHPSARLNVDVCIATYRRPIGLARLLDGIAAQRFERVTRPDLHIIVVDNESVAADGGRAAAVAAAAIDRAPEPLELTCAVEHERGIAFVRNHAVRLVRTNADCVVFVDDDETPDTSWLDELLGTWLEHGGDAVAGPVLARIDPAAPDWIRSGGFHDRARHHTGAEVPYVGTGNVLVRASRLRGDVPPFDPRLALSGGEDTLFFMQLVAGGGRIVWCDEAVVTEDVPASRATPTWILRRAYRGGNAFARCEGIAAAGRHPLRRRLNRAARGLLRMLRGLGRIARAPMHGGRVEALHGARLLVDGIGVWSALLGIGFHEYEHTHGT